MVQRGDQVEKPAGAVRLFVEFKLNHLPRFVFVSCMNADLVEAIAALALNPQLVTLPQPQYRRITFAVDFS